jgi:hypothetical protein
MDPAPTHCVLIGVHVGGGVPPLDEPPEDEPPLDEPPEDDPPDDDPPDDDEPPDDDDAAAAHALVAASAAPEQSPHASHAYVSPPSVYSAFAHCPASVVVQNESDPRAPHEAPLLHERPSPPAVPTPSPSGVVGSVPVVGSPPLLVPVACVQPTDAASPKAPKTPKKTKKRGVRMMAGCTSGSVDTFPGGA